jgi:hypothetical protein
VSRSQTHNAEHRRPAAIPSLACRGPFGATSSSRRSGASIPSASPEPKAMRPGRGLSARAARALSRAPRCALAKPRRSFAHRPLGAQRARKLRVPSAFAVRGAACGVRRFANCRSGECRVRPERSRAARVPASVAAAARRLCRRGSRQRRAGHLAVRTSGTSPALARATPQSRLGRRGASLPRIASTPAAVAANKIAMPSARSPQSASKRVSRSWSIITRVRCSRN